MKVVWFLTDWIGWLICYSYGKIYSVFVRERKVFKNVGPSNIKIPRVSPWAEYTRLKKARMFIDAIMDIEPKDILPEKAFKAKRREILDTSSAKKKAKFVQETIVKITK